MELKNITQALIYTAQALVNEYDEDLQSTINKAHAKNQWFTTESIKQALTYWYNALTAENIAVWIEKEQIANNPSPKNIGIVTAGNIPLVGLHDVVSVLITGNKAVIKPSTDDEELLKFFARKMVEANPGFDKYITFANRLETIDAVIATGSNNTARYFEYYFGKYPNIIRKNRNSIAVLTGNETPETLTKIGADITSYFGKGCRNVTQVWGPQGYNWVKFIDNQMPYKDLINHNKYANNYVYHRALLLMNQDVHLDSGFMLYREDKKIYAPIGMLNYTHYNSIDEVKNFIAENAEAIQCVVSEATGIGTTILPGQTQNPTLWDYADGVNTIQFLKGV
jgi:hypothetical protein